MGAVRLACAGSVTVRRPPWTMDSCAGIRLLGRELPSRDEPALALSLAALLAPQLALLGRGHPIGPGLAAADAGLVELGLPFALGAGLLAPPGRTRTWPHP